MSDATRALIYLGIAVAGMIALAIWLWNPPVEMPMVIDAQSPGAWATYAAADPDVVCIHVLTPNGIRRRNGEVNKT